MTIADNLKRVQANIADACAKANRNPDDVTLVAVTKTKPISSIIEAIKAGQQHFGENRVEEGVDKIPQIKQQISEPTTWHMIGHVQSRKVKQVAPLFDIIHSIDSLKLANRFARLAQENQQDLQVLLEVNVSGEDAKYGFDGYNWHHDSETKDVLWTSVESIIKLPNINVQGLMTMAPLVDNMDEIRPIFAELFALREELSHSFDILMPELSMGMTNDYPIAIEEGATIVRVGRAIFGER